MKAIKKIFVLMAALAISASVFCFTACNIDDSSDNSDGSQNIAGDNGDKDGDDNNTDGGTDKDEKCPDFTISTYNNEEETFTLYDNAGKVIVLNFWYTTSGLCIAEIPHFNALQEKYPDDVKVVIIHEVDPAEGEVIKKIEDMGWSDYKATFAQDDEVFEQGTVSLYHALGGNGPYPMTVILDGEFRITTVRIGGMPANELEETVLEIINHN